MPQASPQIFNPVRPIVWPEFLSHRSRNRPLLAIYKLKLLLESLNLSVIIVCDIVWLRLNFVIFTKGFIIVLWLSISCVNILRYFCCSLLLIGFYTLFHPICTRWLLNVLDKRIEIHLLQLFCIISKVLLSNLRLLLLLVSYRSLLMILAEICLSLINLCCMVGTDRAANLGLSCDLSIDGTFWVGTPTTMKNTSTLRPHAMNCFAPALAVRIVAYGWVRKKLLMNIILRVCLRLRSCRGLLLDSLVYFLLLLLLLFGRLLLNRLLFRLLRL